MGTFIIHILLNISLTCTYLSAFPMHINYFFSEIPIGDLGGSVGLTACYIKGIENGIHRDGNATVVVGASDMRFVAGLKMTYVGLECDWKKGVSIYGLSHTFQQNMLHKMKTVGK